MTRSDAKGAGRPRSSREQRIATENAEQAALARDARDVATLTEIDALVASWLDQMAPLAAPLEHPRRRWAPGDLIDELMEHKAMILRELTRLRGPVVIEDQE